MALVTWSHLSAETDLLAANRPTIGTPNGAATIYEARTVFDAQVSPTIHKGNNTYRNRTRRQTIASQEGHGKQWNDVERTQLALEKIRNGE